MASGYPYSDIIPAVVSTSPFKEPGPTDDIDFGTAWRAMTIREFGTVTLHELYAVKNVALSIIVANNAVVQLENVGSVIRINRYGLDTNTARLVFDDFGYYGSLLTRVVPSAVQDRSSDPHGADMREAQASPGMPDLYKEYMTRFAWEPKKTDGALSWPVYHLNTGASAFFTSFSKHVSEYRGKNTQVLKMAIFLGLRYNPLKDPPPAIAFTKDLICLICKKDNEDLVWSERNGSIRDEILLEVSAILSSKPYEKGEFIRPLRMIMQVATSPVWPEKIASGQTDDYHYVIDIPTAFRVSKIISRDMDNVLSNCNVGDKSPGGTLAVFAAHPRRTELVSLVAHATVFVTKLRRDTAIGSRLISPHVLAQSSREQQAAYFKINYILSGGTQTKRRRGALPDP